MADVNPYGAVTWDKYTLGDGDTFGAYRLYRLNPHTEAYDLIAVVTDIDTVAYSDHLAWPGANTYRLTVSIESGGIVLESEPDDASGTLTFRHGWLHDPGDPAHAVQVLARSLSRSRQPNVTYQFAGGADLPEPYVRRGSNRQWRLSLVPAPIGTGTTWDALADLMERQFTHAAKLCLRLGFRDGERHFVMLDDLGEDMQGGLATPSATATAVSYVEAAT